MYPREIEMFRILNGIGVSRGNAIGKATHYSSDESNNPIILIVPELNRTIVTGLKKNVVGVIAERGNIGCHGAGLLRELKIPCIVKAFSESEKLKEGDFVEIIGDRGLIKVYDLSIGVEGQFWNNISQETNEVCYRPNRIYQKLRFDILKDGWEYSPQYLFGLPKCVLQLKNGIVYITNAPSLSELKEAVLKHPDEYLFLSKKRALDIQRILLELNYINNDLEDRDLKKVYNQFNKCVELYHDLLKYVYMTQFISDDLTDEIVRIIKDVSPDVGAKERFINTLRSEYVVNAAKKNIFPGVSTTWTIPSREVHIWNGNINWECSRVDSKLLEDVLVAITEKGFDLCNRFCALSILVPIIYQLSEEHYHISSSICSHLNKFIEIFSTHLVNQGMLDSEEDILEMPLNNLRLDIEELLNS